MHGLYSFWLCSSGSRDGAFQNVQCLFKLRISDNQRHQQADHIAEGSGREGDNTVLITIACDLFRLFCSRLARARICQLDRAHSAQTANLTNNRPPLLPFACASFKALSKLLGAIREILLLDGSDYRKTGSARNWVAGKSATQATRAAGIHDLSFAGDGGEGQASAQRFRGDKNVRHKTKALAGEHRPGASESCLYLIGDEDNAVFIADGAEVGEKLGGRNDEAAFTEYRLDDDGGDGFLGNVSAKECLKGLRSAVNIALGIGLAVRATETVSIRDAVDVAGKRLETSFVRVCLTGESEAQQSASVKGIFKADDRRPLGVGTQV